MTCALLCFESVYHPYTLRSRTGMRSDSRFILGIRHRHQYPQHQKHKSFTSVLQPATSSNVLLLYQQQNKLENYGLESSNVFEEIDLVSVSTVHHILRPFIGSVPNFAF